MVITKSTPFTKDEIKKTSELFSTYIKAVVDVNKNICSAGADRHFQSEAILLDQGSNQSDLWGGGIDIETREIDCNSFINIRPNDKNNSNEILDPEIRKNFEDLMKYYFGAIL